MSIAKYNDLKAALRGLGVPVVKGNWVRKKDIASALLVLGSEETFKVYKGGLLDCSFCANYFILFKFLVTSRR